MKKKDALDLQEAKERLERFCLRLLNPDDFAHAVSAEVRDSAREALGMRRVEQKAYLPTAKRSG